jgi:DNA-binding MarR family transcriptional regulator
VATTFTSVETLQVGVTRDLFDKTVHAFVAANDHDAALLAVNLLDAVLVEALQADVERVVWLAARVEQLRARTEGNRSVVPEPITVAFGRLRTSLRRRTAYLEQERHHTAAELEASTVKGRILAMVVDHGQVRPRDVALELGLTPPQVSRAFRQLLDDDLVTKTTDPADGRSSLYLPSVQETTDQQLLRVVHELLQRTALAPHDQIADLVAFLQRSNDPVPAHELIS